MFKRIAFLAVFFFLIVGGLAQAWDIADYHIEIQLEKDSRFVVTEKITADFGGESKHGIYRDIPTTYKDENSHPYAVSFEVLAVQDENQDARKYVEENNDNFKRIKIGSPYETVSGRQIYVITYEVSGAILFLQDHDELFWNAIGTQWAVPIDHVYAEVNLPENIPTHSIKITSYTGGYGSKTSNASNAIVNEHQVYFESRNFSPYEGFTIVVGIPKGILTQPPVGTPPKKKPLGWGFLFLPLVTFSIMLKLWQQFGKDPQLNKSIVVEYKAPADLKPAEIGTVLDSQVDQRDITSTMIDLAIRGYLRIVQTKELLWNKKYSLVVLKNFTDDAALKSYEKKFWKAFSVPTRRF